MDSIKPEFGYYTKIIHNVFESRMNGFLKEAGLTATQMEMLKYLLCCKRHGKTIKQKDLENYFHISNPTVSVMLDRLESKGLVSRIRSEDDRRVRYVEPTKKGEDLVDGISESFIEQNRMLTEGLSDEQIEAGMFFLKHVMEKLVGKEESHDQNPCQTD